MNQLIYFIICIVVYSILGYLGYWTCKKFELPQPVLWIFGAMMLIILLVFATGQFGGGIPSYKR